MKPIAPGIYTFEGLLVGRVYLLERGDNLALIDTGTIFAPARIIHQLKASGRRPKQVTQILITHAHTDHVGGLARLKALTGAAVIASERERPIIEGDEPVQFPPLETLSPWGRAMRAGRASEQWLGGTLVDRAVNDGDTVIDGVQAVMTPGHTPGHVTYWLPEQRVAFCGDVVMHFFGRLTQPFAAFSMDMAENRRSIARLCDLQPDVVCFGHGPALTSRAAESLMPFARRIETV